MDGCSVLLGSLLGPGLSGSWKYEERVCWERQSSRLARSMRNSCKPHFPFYQNKGQVLLNHIPLEEEKLTSSMEGRENKK